VLNNWGYSKLSRGAPRDAERLFAEALQHDSTLFTAKNNLVLARAAQRRYELPVIPMTQTERAELLHTMALAAIRQGDTSVGRALLRDAVDTHPQHFEAAAWRWRALNRAARDARAILRRRLLADDRRAAVAAWVVWSDLKSMRIPTRGAGAAGVYALVAR
jgi:hypothetical protein